MIAKIGLIAALIVTVFVGVYGIELGIRVSKGSERPEILAVVLIVLVLLFFINLILLAKHQKTKQGIFLKPILSKANS